MELTDAVAIVTGSSSGVGAAAARKLAGRGVRVLINCSQSVEAGEQIAAECREIGPDATLYQGDVSNDDDCRAMAAAAMERWGRIDVLINSAGTTKFISHYDLDAITTELFQRILSVNTIGPFQMARAVAPHMKAGGQGAIVSISSIAGIRGTGSSIAYAASKAGLNVMTQSLARVLAPEVRVNTICPGFIQGHWLMSALGERYEAAVENQLAISPLGKASTPEEVADVALWLIESAVLITGQVIVADTGNTLGPIGSRPPPKRP
ncbi:MAG: SDR family NAD(P)-dependent oxidoreductase [Alphaproteobacteria bacterium]